MAVFLQGFFAPLAFSVFEAEATSRFRWSAFVVVPSTVPNSLPPAVFAMRGRPGSDLEKRISVSWVL